MDEVFEVPPGSDPLGVVALDLRTASRRRRRRLAVSRHRLAGTNSTGTTSTTSRAPLFRGQARRWPGSPTSTVHTTSGDVVTVPPTASTDWCVFENTSLYSGNTQLPGLLLWPAAVAPVVSEAAEVVQFARDEKANLAWALELTVTGQDGMPLDRHTHASSSADGGGVLPRGRVRRARPARCTISWPRPCWNTGSRWWPTPAGRLLATATAFSLCQEEIPREGTQVVREHRLIRGLTGQPVSWSARRASAGRGPASSSLRYDQAVAPDLAAGS